MNVMRKRKMKIIVGITVLVVVIIGGIVLKIDGLKKNIVMNDEKKAITSTNALTMMYETEAGSGEYEVVSNSTWPQDGYIFNEELSSCENGGTLSWNDETNKVIMKSNTSDKCYVYFDVYEPTLAELCSGKTFANCITEEVYTSDGENGLYYHDGIGSYTNASEEAGDNSYRFSGANPNNYVCFASDATACPEENLYRIIGVFNGRVKLIKADFASEDILGTPANGFVGPEDTYKGSLTNIPVYNWSDIDNVFVEGKLWSGSVLNTNVLNGTYLTNMGSVWSSMIVNTTWQTGGTSYDLLQTATIKTAYTNEIITPVTDLPYIAKVGLMYASDYGYAATPDAWTTTLYEYNSSTIRDNNWLYIGGFEWVITPRSDAIQLVYRLNSAGSVISGAFKGSEWGVRPTFYLGSNASLGSGTGTKSDPYRIWSTTVAP